ncbi:AAA family ATPase [Companilactobacillus suantsaicola]|nr:AAA family ATPase [Companilactobacillus suantsaicola]
MLWNQIRINAPYLNDEDLKIDFESKNKKGNKKLNAILIFGRNGTGKTTISSAVNNTINSWKNIDSKENLKENAENEIMLNTASFYEKRDDEISCLGKLDSDEYEHFYVYNRFFIENQVNFSTNDELQAIVRLKNQIDLQKQYDDLKEKSVEIRNEKENVEKYIERLDEGSSIDSPDFHYRKIKKELKKVGKWSEISGRIDGDKINKKVTKRNIDLIRNVKIVSTDNVKQLQNQLNKLISSIKSMRNSSSLDNYNVQCNPNSEEKIIKILSEKPPIVNSDEYKNRISNTIDSRSITPKQRLEVFSNNNVTYCPMCLRDISEDEKNEIISIVKSVLNDIQMEDYLKKVDSIVIKSLNNIPIESKIFEEFHTEALNLNLKINTYNDSVEKIKEIFRVKKANPYKDIDVNQINLDSKFEEINKDEIDLHEKIFEYNKKFDMLIDLQKEAHQINDKIAAIELKEEFKEWDQAKENYSSTKNKLQSIERSEDENKIDLLKVENKINGQEIALKDINKMLASVFMDPNRISLQEGKNCYKVLSRGKPIGLKSLSTGESNAIRLCYFFSTINKNLSISDEYTKKSLIILDDPVSSFDFENKIGILSLINDKVKDILFGNEDSKVLLMTHDFEIFSHLDKIMNNISTYKKNLIKWNESLDRKERKRISNGQIYYSKYLLDNGNLEEITKKSSNDYENELNAIYSYANDEDKNLDAVIGNRMRRVVEGFSSFCYCLSSREIFTDPQILNLLGDERLEKFYSSFDSRLVLDNESHFVNKVQSITDSSWMKFIGHEELVKTAKLVILFMYKINPTHLEKNINEFDENKVNSWINLINY